MANEGLRDEFSDVVRGLIWTLGEGYVAFPITDEADGYERVFLLPLPSDC